MKSVFKVLFLVSQILCLNSIIGQTNYEPANSSVYDFLKQMSNKGIIQINEEIKSFIREYIGKRISNKEEMNKLEEQELEFHVRE